MMFLFDVRPDPVGGSTVGLIVGAVFFFIALGSGLAAFAMLRKTVKMAFRMIIVAVVLIVAIIGGTALYLFLKPASQSSDRPIRRPSANSTR